MKTFEYPLPLSAMEAFCHPEAEAFRSPFRFRGGVCAANGFLAILAHRGRWMDAEFQAATEEQAARLNRFPWDKATIAADEWNDLTPHRGDLDRFAGMGMWFIGRPAPCPIWKVGHITVRTTHLALVASLPRPELAWTNGSGFLWFRCTGALGIIAADPRLTVWSRELFHSRKDRLTGETIQHVAKPQQGPRFSIPNWPPAEEPIP